MSRYRSIVGIYRGLGPPAVVRVRALGAGRIHIRMLQDAAPGETQPGEACALTLPSDQVFLRVLSIRPKPGQRESDAIAEHVAHFDEGGEVETVRALGRRHRLGETCVVLFALARRIMVDKILREAERRSLEAVDLIPDLLALYNGAAAQLRTRAPLLCVRIGPEATDLFLGRGRIPLMSRRLALGTQALNAPDSSEKAWKTWEEEVKAALSFAGAHRPEGLAQPRTIVLFSEQEQTAPFRERIEAIVGAPCRDAADLPEARREGAGAGFTLALGCAVTGLGRGRIPLGVFPQDARMHQTLRRQASWWTAAALASCLGMLFPAYRLHQSRVYHRRQVRRMQSRLDRISGLERELQGLQSRNQALRRGMAPLRGTVYGSDAVRRTLQAVASAKHENDWIILAADAVHYLDQGRISARRPDGRAGTPIEHLVVEGYTPAHDLSTVRAMIERLRQYTVIAEADLLADDRLRKDPDRDRVWAPLDCRLFALEIRTVIP